MGVQLLLAEAHHFRTYYLKVLNLCSQFFYFHLSLFCVFFQHSEFCHSVCTLQAFAQNFTERAREKEHVRERAKEKEKKAQQKKKKVIDLERVGQKMAYANKEVLTENVQYLN